MRHFALNEKEKTGRTQRDADQKGKKKEKQAAKRERVVKTQWSVPRGEGRG